MKQSEVELLKSLLIKKSKIKSENGVLEIANTADGLKARMISIEANKLYQDTREGYNKLIYPYIDTTKTVNGITFTDVGDGTVIANGTAVADAYFNLSQPTLKAGKYLYTTGVSGSTSTYFAKFGTTNIINKSTLNVVEEFTPAESYICIKNGTTVNNLIFQPMLVEGTYTTENVPGFEEYGEKPSFDFESEVLGITGDINIKNKNANYLDESKLVEKTTLGITSKRENGNIIFNGTGTSSNAYLINSLEVELEKGDYFFNWFGKHKNPYFTLRSQSGDFIQNLVGSSSNNNEINVEEKTVYQIGLHGIGTAKYTPEDTCFTLMISKKNDEKYTEYQSQTHTISLDSKIMYGNENTRDGIALKNGKWNWKNLWKKEVFDGVNNKLELIASSNVNKIFTSSLRNNIKTPSNNSTISTIKCNYLKATSFTDLSNNAKEGLAVRADKLICFAFNLESVTDLNAANSKLQELNASGDPLYVLYELAEPEYEEITNEILISQLNKLLYQLEEYDDKTYISSDREIEFEMLIEQDKLRILESGGNIYE